MKIIATYRVQLNKDFTLRDLRGIIPYLHDLGISHIYCSPLLDSVPGSPHGYDVIDFTKVSAERGGEEELKALDEDLKKLDPPMGLILDIVPNHMAANEGNPWWTDVTTKGPKSEFWPLYDMRVDSGGHIGHRRFFNIDSLVGVRVEDKKNYDLTHEKIFDLLGNTSSITGLRVDHIDGLADPARYLQWLSQDCGQIWIEKILGPEEGLQDWPVAGTTGYEFIDRVNRLFVHPDWRKVEEYWRKNIENRWSGFEDCVIHSKEEIIVRSFNGELQRLVDFSGGVAGAHDFWLKMTAALPVYRTYITSGSSESDRDCIRATAGACGMADHPLLRSLLDPQMQHQKQAACEWQQLSGAAMAKGLEDTAHYRYTPLAAFNDVGCETPKENSEDFFGWLEKRIGQTPRTMNATSTHDTKRSEDTRHRLYALADRPEEWIEFFERAVTLTAPLKRNGEPDRSVEYWLYQALVGTWPLDGNIDAAYRNRLATFLEKSLREKKDKTNWLNPDKTYESNVQAFLSDILGDKSFLAHMQGFADRIAWPGAMNSLAVQTLKILTPGVPDIYQGTECWNFCLVDPDNRQPVDFDQHRRLLTFIDRIDREESRDSLINHLCLQWKDSAIKQWLTRELLSIRSKFYPRKAQPLDIDGQNANCLIAYQLDTDSGALVVVVPRYPGKLIKSAGADLKIPAEVWSNTRITMPGAQAFINPLTVKSLTPEQAADPAIILKDLPVAVMHIHR
ncbi:MAG TPA: alpha-amylase family glycosyl hydrolase [Patescibacteria group bacterium]|nr:alpha-amylase family glycosyl hydrolase [Patescibacteria group bacterium]